MYGLVVTLAALAAAPSEMLDLVVYGGTSAGIAAAVEAARLGKTVVVVAPETHLGGLTSGGLGWTDSGRKEAVGGFAREFYQRLKKHYDGPDAWRQQKPEQYRLYHKDDDVIWAFEPHVAERAFEEYVKELKIPVLRNEWLDRGPGGVVKDGPRIVRIVTLSRKSFVAKMFMDATYEGDLMAAAKVSYTVGREANAQYGETLNGVQVAHAVSHQFDRPVDPYNTPGDPSSGLLPRIHAGSPGKDGEADKRLQAYCFRMCLTDAPENRVAFAKPEGYDPRQYELLGRYLRAGWAAVFNKYDPVPNRKTDTNNHGGFSTDNIGMNYDYPEATYERRREIVKEHEQYQKGYLYYLANDPGVPESMRKAMSKWGLAKDEFVDNGNWPHQIYVREARRMVSDFVMTEDHLTARKPTPDPIGMGSYNMDSHNVQRYVDPSGHARNEGDIQVSPGGPYPISFRAIVPKASECTNLLVPVCLSSSHIAYGSIRMEPVFLILGQSAAAAASLAIDGKTSVQDVDYAKLRGRLAALKQVLDLPRPKDARSLSAKSLPGVVVDDADAELTGTWSHSSTVGPYVGSGYRHDGNAEKGSKAAVFRTTLEPGRYQIRVSYSPNANRAAKVPVTIRSGGKTEARTYNQKAAPGEDSAFASLGFFDLGGPVAVEIRNEGTDGYVIVDAVQFLPVKGN